jgi:hypothetical protein
MAQLRGGAGRVSACGVPSSFQCAFNGLPVRRLVKEPASTSASNESKRFTALLMAEGRLEMVRGMVLEPAPM